MSAQPKYAETTVDVLSLLRCDPEDERRLIPLDVMVLDHLIFHCPARGGFCWPSTKEIAATVRRTSRPIQFSLARLEAAGLIRRQAVDNPEPDKPENLTGRRIYLVGVRAVRKAEAGRP